MAIKRPIGVWEDCWRCSGGLIKCCECGTIQDKCDYCQGLGFILQPAWIREPDDPPPMTTAEFIESWEPVLKETFDHAFGNPWEDVFK